MCKEQYDQAVRLAEKQTKATREYLDSLHSLFFSIESSKAKAMHSSKTSAQIVTAALRAVNASTFIKEKKQFYSIFDKAIICLVIFFGWLKK